MTDQMSTKKPFFSFENFIKANLGSTRDDYILYYLNNNEKAKAELEKHDFSRAFDDLPLTFFYNKENENNDNVVKIINNNLLTFANQQILPIVRKSKDKDLSTNFDALAIERLRSGKRKCPPTIKKLSAKYADELFKIVFDGYQINPEFKHFFSSKNDLHNDTTDKLISFRAACISLAGSGIETAFNEKNVYQAKLQKDGKTLESNALTSQNFLSTTNEIVAHDTFPYKTITNAALRGFLIAQYVEPKTHKTTNNALVKQLNSINDLKQLRSYIKNNFDIPNLKSFENNFKKTAMFMAIDDFRIEKLDAFFKLTNIKSLKKFDIFESTLSKRQQENYKTHINKMRAFLTIKNAKRFTFFGLRTPLSEANRSKIYDVLSKMQNKDRTEILSLFKNDQTLSPKLKTIDSEIHAEHMRKTYEIRETYKKDFKSLIEKLTQTIEKRLEQNEVSNREQIAQMQKLFKDYLQTTPKKNVPTNQEMAPSRQSSPITAEKLTTPNVDIIKLKSQKMESPQTDVNIFWDRLRP